MAFARLWLVVLLSGFCAGVAAETTTSFHYAGTLTDSQMAAATGSYDIRVRLYDGSGVGASQLGTDVLLPAVQVTLGFFAIDIDFGTAILAPQSWLEFAVQPTGGAGFQTLSPRQQIGHVPFALYAEGADWAGLTNVPPGVAALTNAVPPAIGSIATTPMLAGATSGTNQLVVRQAQVAVTRQVSTGPPVVLGTPASDIELWLEPTLAFPAMVSAVNAETVFSDLTLNLNFVGTASNTIAKFSNVFFVGADLVPAPEAGGTTLAHVKLLATSVQAIAPSFNYTFSFQTLSGSGMPPACPAFLNTLAYGAVPADFPGSGFVTLPQPKVFDVSRPATTSLFLHPEFSVTLSAANATASTSAVTCALAMATSNQQVSPAPTWSEYPAGAADSTSWDLQVTWGGVYLSGFGLNSDASGKTTLSWEFTPTTTYKVVSLNAAKTSSHTSCFNVSTNAAC